MLTPFIISSSTISGNPLADDKCSAFLCLNPRTLGLVGVVDSRRVTSCTSPASAAAHNNMEFNISFLIEGTLKDKTDPHIT